MFLRHHIDIPRCVLLKRLSLSPEYGNSSALLMKLLFLVGVSWPHIEQNRGTFPDSVSGSASFKVFKVSFP